MTARHGILNHSVGGSGHAPPAKAPPAHYTAAQNASFNAWAKKHPFKQASGAGGPKKAKKASHAKKAKRGFTPDDVMQICSARAVAEAVRLASGPVLSDADVLSLYWTTASDPDAGQTLSDALSAIQEMVGVTGEIALDAAPLDAVAVAAVLAVGDVDQRLVDPRPALVGVVELDGCGEVIGTRPLGSAVKPAFSDPSAGPHPWRSHAVIVGLDLPGGHSHAVAVGPDGTWWSWGEPFNPDEWPGLVIDEAWAVSVA